MFNVTASAHTSCGLVSTGLPLTSKIVRLFFRPLHRPLHRHFLLTISPLLSLPRRQHQNIYTLRNEFSMLPSNSHSSNNQSQITDVVWASKHLPYNPPVPLYQLHPLNAASSLLTPLLSFPLGPASFLDSKSANSRLPQPLILTRKPRHSSSNTSPLHPTDVHTAVMRNL